MNIKSAYKLLLLAISLSFFHTTLAQDTISAKYFPLKVGNSWVYRTTYYPIPFPPTIRKVQIFRDTIINSKRYFLYGTEPSLNSSNWIRYDSSTGNLLAYSSNGGCSIYPNDKIIDSLASSPGNQINCQYGVTYTRLCLSVGDIILFNSYQTQKKDFKHDGLIYENYTYAKNFGIIYSCSGEPPPCSGFSDLKGCVINGIVYGDTTLTNIQKLSNSVPEKFSLSQNYPNPFNPKTIINYQLPMFSDVKL